MSSRLSNIPKIFGKTGLKIHHFVHADRQGGRTVKGLNKPKTKLGKWMEKRRITNTWLAKKAGLNKDTVTNLTFKQKHAPTQTTMRKVLKALREIDPRVKAEDFWDM
jgi:predicted transcriptional regulator